MIIVELKGGLGNQLFQYAAGRALALQHGCPVLLDASHYRTDQLRNFDLLQYEVDTAMADAPAIARLQARTTAARIWNRLLPHARRRFYKQPYFHFDPDFFRLGPDTLIRGYFQSEKYFAPAAEQIRSEFRLRNAPAGHISAFGATLRQQASVSLHVRRGDYKNAEANRYHGIVPLSYYQHCIEEMRRRVPQARFYLFTDDPEWVATHLPVEGSELVSGRVSKTHFEDLYLMQHCRHHILANSSFSWWGAWLNPMPDKIVMAPRNWFNEGPSDTQDLLPQGWLRF